METILRPIVEAAGYDVVAAGSAPADVVIASADGDPIGQSQAAEVIRLRSAPDPLGHADDSIYRYDRAALLAALGRGRTGKRVSQ